MSTVKANSYYDSSGGSAAQLYGVSMRNGGTAWVNRIINGDMRVNQRNTSLTATGYSVDRWAFDATQNSKATVAQATVVPSGFTNSLGVTSSSAYTLAAGDYFTLSQPIEGLNTADLAWGTSSAVSVTLSFQVRSSLTGMFGGVVYAGTGSLSYPFSFTINSANTFESKSITIPGPTTGTWSTDNTRSIVVCFGLGVGSTYSGTAGSWQASVLRSVTGATSVVGTSGATFYITGVQLEAGTVASPFERLDYGRQLIQCQRYYEYGLAANFAVCTNGVGFGVPVLFKVEKRAAPTIVSTSLSSNIGSSSAGPQSISVSGYAYSFIANGTGAGNVQISYTAASEL